MSLTAVAPVSVGDVLAGCAQWYQAHAVWVFVVLVFSMIVGERLWLLVRRSPQHLGVLGATAVSGGLFLVVKTVVGKLGFTALALFVFNEFRIWTLPLDSVWTWVGVFVVRDFVYYWVHRLEHSVRILWCSHAVHHSPETISVATAVRVPWMEALYKPWFSLWMPLVGFNPLAAIAFDVFAATLSQFQHTTAFKQTSWLAKVFITPSLHRVHHGSNLVYIDKNFGAVFSRRVPS